MRDMEEVRIRLRSIRYEVEESLFSVEDGEGVRMMEDGGAPEPQTIDINTVGKRERSEGRLKISYEETEATGMDGSVTEITFLTDQPEVVSMIREGAVSTALVFEEGKRHHCLYQTPFMPFEICVRTIKVENRLMEDGYLALDYVIEIRGAKAERTKFRMEVL
ncbi:MAG: DUF1934 domain-containing protein [Clostridia bacterium]|nr:DUF1934 domain-containing protein [Clostridia bacterium]